jgi:hypothetical protein
MKSYILSKTTNYHHHYLLHHGLLIFKKIVITTTCFDLIGPFGPKRDEVTGEWRKLHSEELHNVYSPPDTITQVKSRRIRWAGHVARMGEERKMYKVSVGKPEGKRPLGRPRRRWEDGIRLALREIGLGGVDWILLAQDRDWRRCCDCGDEPSGSCATVLVSYYPVDRNQYKRLQNCILITNTNTSASLYIKIILTNIV